MTSPMHTRPGDIETQDKCAVARSTPI